MSEPDRAEDDIEAPDMVHWSPRHGPTVGGPIHWPTLPLTAVGAVAVGGLTIFAFAIGALAIGRLLVGQAVFKDVKIGRLEVGDLVVLHRDGRRL